MLTVVRAEWNFRSVTWIVCEPVSLTIVPLDPLLKFDAHHLRADFSTTEDKLNNSSRFS